MARTLIDRGAACEVSMPGCTHEVCFSVREFESYGELSRRNTGVLEAGACVENRFLVDVVSESCDGGAGCASGLAIPIRSALGPPDIRAPPMACETSHGTRSALRMG